MQNTSPIEGVNPSCNVPVIDIDSPDDLPGWARARLTPRQLDQGSKSNARGFWWWQRLLREDRAIDGVTKAVLRALADHYPVMKLSRATLAAEAAWCERVTRTAVDAAERAGWVTVHPELPCDRFTLAIPSRRWSAAELTDELVRAGVWAPSRRKGRPR